MGRERRRAAANLATAPVDGASLGDEGLQASERDASAQMAREAADIMKTLSAFGITARAVVFVEAPAKQADVGTCQVVPLIGGDELRITATEYHHNAGAGFAEITLWRGRPGSDEKVATDLRFRIDLFEFDAIGKAIGAASSGICLY